MCVLSNSLTKIEGLHSHKGFYFMTYDRCLGQIGHCHAIFEGYIKEDGINVNYNVSTQFFG
jgi:hypothetical protein